MLPRSYVPPLNLNPHSEADLGGGGSGAISWSLSYQDLFHTVLTHAGLPALHKPQQSNTESSVISGIFPPYATETPLLEPLMRIVAAITFHLPNQKHCYFGQTSD